MYADIHTPEELKDNFAEMIPIFKNTMVSREDVGDYMKSDLLTTDIVKCPQRQLIGSYLAKRIILGSQILNICLFVHMFLVLGNHCKGCFWWNTDFNVNVL